MMPNQYSKSPSKYLIYNNTVIRISSDHLPTAKNIADGKIKNALKLDADKIVEKNIAFKVIDFFDEKTIDEVKKDIDRWV